MTFLVLVLLGYVELFVADKTSDDHAHAFCEYMKNTPEPRVLIYNRIPKCGSQSLTNLLLYIQKHDSSIDEASRWRQYWWPRDMDVNFTLAMQFASAVKSRLARKKRVRITGHWYWHSFDAVNDFGLTRKTDVEYINIIRKCSDRFKSQLLFELFDTKEAKEAASNKEILSHHMSILHRNITVQQCIENYTCLEDVFRRRILLENKKSLSGMMVEFLSGTKTKEAEGSYYAGAINHLNKDHPDDEGYSVIGFLEHYEESLELLECAYPSFFRNALKIYLKQKIHKHRSSVVSDGILYSHSNFDRVLQPICDIADNMLYTTALDQFWSKLKTLRNNRTTCCRARTNA